MKVWTQEMLRKVTDSHLATARQIAVDAEVEPVAFVFCAVDGEAVICQVGTREFSQSGKDNFSDFLRFLVGVSDADAILFVCEAWMVDGGDAAAAQLSRRHRLSEHPDAFEVIHGALETADGTVTMFVARISGSPPGRTVEEYSEKDPLAEGGSCGRFANFFGDPEREAEGVAVLARLDAEDAPFPSPEDD